MGERDAREDLLSEEAVPEVRLGSALLSLLDPTPGAEVAFHRWYERDHFYAGALAGPGFFAGRRFVATRTLKDLRYPAQTPVIDDIRRGSYLALYWLLAGLHDESEAWAVRRVTRLIAQGRMLPSRRQALAGFQRLRWTAARDPDGVPAELALDHPFAGVALVMVDRAEGVAAPRLDAWYREVDLPRRLAGSAAALCLCFEPLALPDAAPSYVARAAGLEQRSLYVYFLDEDPLGCWPTLFADHGAQLHAEGLGEVTYAAPFVPTLPGTDRYTDQLW